MKIHAHKTGIFGIQESGKTYWMKKMHKKFERPIVFSVNPDDGWESMKSIYVYAANRLKPQEEFRRFIKWVHKLAMDGKVDLIVIDEADMFIANNWDVVGELNDLVLNHRHFNDGRGVALWFATRRPQDIPTKIVESCRNLVIFKLEGANAVQRFKEIHPELPDMIESLDYAKHNFIVKEIGKAPVMHKPL